MADEIKRWPWALNQPGYKYPAEIVRGKHFAATGGGTGVDHPLALKVEAQEAPDNTVRIRPGGGTAKTTYPGQGNQSYQATSFQPVNVEFEPTGSSSGGRHDLLIQRFLDPDHEDHPDVPSSVELTEEIAKDLDFWWFEVYQGRSSRTEFDFPHVKLAHIRRGPNKTIIEPGDIVDLRQLAAPKTWLHMKADNLNVSDKQSLHSARRVWPRHLVHEVTIPEWATYFQHLVMVNQISSHPTAGDQKDAAGGLKFYLIHPDGTELTTQNTTWRTIGELDKERFSIGLAGSKAIPAKFRGETVRVETVGWKTRGPNVYADGPTNWSVQIYFEQRAL